jgi:antitoxin VapB
MATAKVFKSGNSQAVRLPKEFRVKGTELEIFRRDDEIVLRERKKARRSMAEVFDLIAQMPEDMFENIKDVRPPEKRKGL